MTKNAPPILPHIRIEANDDGYVSARCRYLDDHEAGMRAIFVDGICIAQYHKDDSYEERSLWIQVHLRGFATQRQIAQGVGLSSRSFTRWLARYREEGAEGLRHKPKCGAPRKVNQAVVQRIYALRDQGLKVRLIADHLHLSKRSVEAVLHARKVANEQKAPFLCESEPTNEPEEAPPQIPDDEQCDQQQTPTHTPDASTEDEPALAAGNLNPPEPEPCDLGNVASQTTFPADLAPTTARLLADELEDALARDRSIDRAAAAAGQLQDAPPLFHNADHVAFAGVFIAIAAIAADPFLDCAMRRYGQFQAAFYGTRTIFLVLLMMLLMRWRRVEGLKDVDPSDFGFVLGLDRSPETKTVRRRLLQLVECQQGAELMGDVAEARWGANGKVIYFDNHVQVYHGKQRLGKVFSNRTKQVHKGRSEQWAHAADGTALFVIESDFNETLIALLRKQLPELLKALAVESLDIVFDRAGYEGKFLADLKDSESVNFTVYRRGPYADLPEDELTIETTTIGPRTYLSRPYDHDVTINVYENVENDAGKTTRKKTGTVTLREIRLLSETGKQLAIFTSHERTQVSPVEVVERVQGRWGNQENVLKYAREQFDLDGLWTYRTVPIVDPELDHPNPDLKADRAALTQAQAARNKIYRRYGADLLAIGEARDPEAVTRVLDRISEQDLKSLSELDEKIERLRTALSEKPERTSAQDGEFRALCGDVRLLQNCLIASADYLEKRLVTLLGDDYSRNEDEGRAFVARALRSSGAVRLAPGKLLITLSAQSSPHRTRALNALCAKLTALGVRYPGSARMIEFVPTLAPPPPRYHKHNPRPESAT